LAALHAAESTRKPARAGELAAEVKERAIEDEILYREGEKLGFDKSDYIVRQRVIQKVLFLAEELAGATQSPTDAQLRAFFAATPSRWTQPEVFHFRQIFASDERGIRAIQSRLQQNAGVTASLQSDSGTDFRRLGYPCPVPFEVTLLERAQ
jgi:hypothetical protein